MLPEREFYQRLLEALEKLPTHRLARYQYWDIEDKCGCALGAYMLKIGTEPNEACYMDVPAYQRPGVRVWEGVHGRNDAFDGTPEERWEYMRNWVKEKLDGPFDQ